MSLAATVGTDKTLEAAERCFVPDLLYLQESEITNNYDEIDQQYFAVLESEHFEIWLKGALCSCKEGNGGRNHAEDVKSTLYWLWRKNVT